MRFTKLTKKEEFMQQNNLDYHYLGSQYYALAN